MKQYPKLETVLDYDINTIKSKIEQVVKSGYHLLDKNDLVNSYRIGYVKSLALNQSALFSVSLVAEGDNKTRIICNTSDMEGGNVDVGVLGRLQSDFFNDLNKAFKGEVVAAKGAGCLVMVIVLIMGALAFYCVL